MDSRDALKLSIDGGSMVCDPYLADLTDEEMMVRPHPKCNHIKWQLGHLIVSENQMIEGIRPGSMPSLPEGFADKYTKEMATSNDAAAFDSKAELVRLYQQQRDATLTALRAHSDEDLEGAAPEAMREYAPTVASVFNLIGAHWLMHGGQWAVIRRACGRDPLF